MNTNSQTKFLSDNYSALHGLNAVPVGLGLFLASLWTNLVQYPIQNFILPIVILFGVLLFAIAVDKYYKHTFGEVKPTLHKRHLYWMAQGVWGVLGLAAFWVDVTFDLPINFIGLIFASAFLFDKPAVTFPLNKFAAVRLAVSICIIFVSIAPIFLGINWWEALGVRTTVIGVPMFVGVLMVIQGVIWHIFFVKSLPGEEV